MRAGYLALVGADLVLQSRQSKFPELNGCDLKNEKRRQLKDINK